MKTICKRTFDILSASMGSVILIPIFLTTGIAIKMIDGGPVFYKQPRLTRDGKIFEIYKFRSMDADTEKVTTVGRFIREYHIDELPQLLNIIAGDMSMVGPRPERPELAEGIYQIVPEFKSRLKVKAGLTGYAQVFCNNNDDPGEKLKYDLIYIDNMSMLTDLRILFETFRHLFSKGR